MLFFYGAIKHKETLDMPILLRELAQKIGATILRGDGGLGVDGAANLADAGPNHIAFFADVKFYADQLPASKAGAIIVKSDSAKLPATAAVLLVADPEMAFLAALNHFYPEVRETPGVDARAVVEPGAEIAPGAHVAAFAVVRSGARVGARSVVLSHSVIGRGAVVGEDCRIYPQVVIYDGVRLGARCTVHSGAILGADGFGYKFRGGKHVKVPQVGIVEIGDDVEIGANTCIDRAALGATRVGSGTKIDNLVQIGHNASIGKHCILCGQAALAGSSGLDDYVVIGGNVGLADHVFMGKGSKAGAKSGVGSDVPPGMEVWGYVAEERKTAFSQLRATKRLPDLVERVRELEQQLRKFQQDSAAQQE
jgi:UDP-3-O-[3-hydroxymyristoyl] glucosamine N-acyltransferase